MAKTRFGLILKFDDLPFKKVNFVLGIQGIYYPNSLNSVKQYLYHVKFASTFVKL